MIVFASYLTHIDGFSCRLIAKGTEQSGPCKNKLVVASCGLPPQSLQQTSIFAVHLGLGDDGWPVPAQQPPEWVLASLFSFPRSFDICIYIVIVSNVHILDHIK